MMSIASNIWKNVSHGFRKQPSITDARVLTSNDICNIKFFINFLFNCEGVSDELCFLIKENYKDIAILASIMTNIIPVAPYCDAPLNITNLPLTCDGLLKHTFRVCSIEDNRHMTILCKHCHIAYKVPSFSRGELEDNIKNFKYAILTNSVISPTYQKKYIVNSYYNNNKSLTTLLNMLDNTSLDTFQMNDWASV